MIRRFFTVSRDSRQLLLLLCSLLLVSGAPVCRAVDQPAAVRPPDPEVQQRCLQILRAGLAADEFWPAMHAAEALTLAGHPAEVILVLRPRLPLEQDAQRRCGLARELARAGDTAAVQVLWEILADPQSTGRVHAAESLYKLAASSDGRLLQEARAAAQPPQLQLMAAAALARAGDTAALAWLRAQLLSAERPVRNTAAWALGRLGSDVDRPVLTRQLQIETDPLARAMLIIALASLGDPAGRDQLRAQLAAPDAGIRALSAECVGYSRCQQYQARLMDLLQDPAQDVRIRAAQSLLQLSTAAPPPVSQGQHP